jgi:adenylate cyclase
VDAERASLFLVDDERRELWLKVAQREGGEPVDVRVPIDRGIAGHVATTGRSLRVDDAYAHPLFNPDVDRATGFRTRSVLCMPIADRTGRVFAVAQILNKRDGAAFTELDEERFADFARAIGPVLESWARMSRRGPAASPSGAMEGRAESAG